MQNARDAKKRDILHPLGRVWVFGTVPWSWDVSAPESEVYCYIMLCKSIYLITSIM